MYYMAVCGQIQLLAMVKNYPSNGIYTLKAKIEYIDSPTLSEMNVYQIPLKHSLQKKNGAV